MAADTDIPDDIRARAAKIKLAAFDVDGTLTDGRLWFDDQGRELKAFHVHDGLGLKRLRAHGVEVALISARCSGAVVARAGQLGIQHLHQGVSDKLQCLRELLERLGLADEEACYAGDDLPDLAPMSICGLAIAVADARAEVIRAAHWRTPACGGTGAARDVAELILAARTA